MEFPEVASGMWSGVAWCVLSGFGGSGKVGRLLAWKSAGTMCVRGCRSSRGATGCTTMRMKKQDTGRCREICDGRNGRQNSVNDFNLVECKLAALSRRCVVRAMLAASLSVFFEIGGQTSASAAMYDDKKVSVPVSAAMGSPLEKFLPQIDAGLDTLLELQREWDAKTEALDGDVVRRYLGTVGVKSPLFKIRKAFEGAWRALSELPSVSDETLEEVNELYNKVLDGISAVDFQLYSVNYTELTPTKLNLVKQGKAALDNTVELYRSLASILHAACE
eukprot:CAMPEP_0185845816 /NCGR_PEP_ID=MMETSP1354-20130828/1681_1 /TAXON_ID=708628 /ORGANISM="Erythrolobus madagascarensis, Strain CCMP3276" /LENGTH=276 /DNA_ID=CAMNT_0028545869 /DNA_START=1 /DNA_END=831 /DNA_ORIENTATION=+